MFRANKIGPLTVAAFVTAGLGMACEGVPTSGDIAPVQVRLFMADGISASAADPLLSASVNGALVSISPADIESFMVNVTAVGFLPLDASDGDGDGTDGDGTDEESAWMTFPVDGLIDSLDLMALPGTDAGEPYVISLPDVPMGDYGRVRLMVSGGSIVFNKPISIGNGHAWVFIGGVDPAESYDVTIPSGEEAGLKANVVFEVSDETAGVLDLAFELGTTFQNVTVTGNGKVILTPVLRAK